MKTKTSNKEKETMPYFRDSEVYALWKYLNGNLTGRNVFKFADLTAPNVSESSIAYFLSNFFNWLGIKFEKPVFHEVTYWLFNIKNKDAKKAKRLLKTLNKDFNVAELKNNALLLGKYGALEFIEFEKNITKKHHNKLADYFDFYIDFFITDELEQEDSNHLKFEAQKQKTLKLINDHKDKYGNEFILKYKPAENEFSPYHDTYLFIHSIVALEKLGNIKIKKAWYYDDIDPEKQINDFKIKLAVIEPKTKKVKQKKFDPMLRVEKNIGYFKFYKEAPKIKIGNIRSRHYRLLEALINPVGVAKTVDIVFDAIRLPKDKIDSRLKDQYLARNRQIDLIKYSMKELQKINGLRNKICLEFYDNNRTVSIKLIS